ncbi:MAG: right-handed parallel beta-helix repeat-containing protein, partial [Planctomycetes bacterium]|nr:right-handed parallel beta-helix repeat-containing protein [Planctomycetota bacterium]
MRILAKLGVGVILAFLFACGNFLTGLQPAFTGTINVPTSKPTIQAGIDAATSGDTVLVAPGTYYERINFYDKSITVKSSGGASGTIIDGSYNGSVVTFYENTGRTTLDSFTIRNGSGTLNVEDGDTYGGGIYCFNSYPAIINNIIKSNSADGGGGICCEGYDSFPNIYNNTILSNTGAGIYCKDGASPTVFNNIVVSNTASSGGGGMFADESTTPDADDNDVWNNSAPQYGGDGWDFGIAGKNINADPRFVNAAVGDYHLKDTSPCINVGTGINYGAPNHDFEGETRPFNGKVDIGADEFVGTVSTTCSCEGESTGCISGLVTKKGVALKKKTVKLILKRTGSPKETFNTNTNTSGCYLFTGLPLVDGTYTIK